MNAPSSPWIVDHIGIAVADLDAAIALYASTAGTSVTHREKLLDRGVELAFLNTGGTKLELLAPLKDDTPIARFLAKHGPGLHHVCYKVDNIRTEMARLESLGAQLIDTTPRPGASGTIIAFIQPASFSGVLTELCENTAS
jgi:methylmalonyl-CoA epimerase